MKLTEEPSQLYHIGLALAFRTGSDNGVRSRSGHEGRLYIRNFTMKPWSCTVSCCHWAKSEQIRSSIPDQKLYLGLMRASCTETDLAHRTRPESSSVKSGHYLPLLPIAG